MNQPCLKITSYFGERERAVGNGRPTGFLADAILGLYERHSIATSVMLRGIASFGPRNVVRSDESLSLSEDPPVAIVAVDQEAKIAGLVDEVATMTGRGLVTVEKALPVDDGQAPNPGDETVTLTVFVGRQERFGGAPAHRALCDLLFRHGFFCATAYSGVDGTAHGERYRAAFFSRNVDVPLMVVSVGAATQLSGALTELAATAPRALLTVERIQLCKRGGESLARPDRLPDVDPLGKPLWQKLTVHTSEADTHDGTPIHRALVRRLHDSGRARGCTVLRGIWGFHDGCSPHGDRLSRLARTVPVSTVVIDSPDGIAGSFAIVDELTAAHGSVTSEMVPAVISVTGADRR